MAELTISTGDTGCNFGSNGDVQWRATIGGSKGIEKQPSTLIYPP